MRWIIKHIDIYSFIMSETIIIITYYHPCAVCITLVAVKDDKHCLIHKDVMLCEWICKYLSPTCIMLLPIYVEWMILGYSLLEFIYGMLSPLVTLRKLRHTIIINNDFSLHPFTHKHTHENSCYTPTNKRKQSQKLADIQNFIKLMQGRKLTYGLTHLWSHTLTYTHSYKWSHTHMNSHIHVHSYTHSQHSYTHHIHSQTHTHIHSYVVYSVQLPVKHIAFDFAVILDLAPLT